MKDTTNEVNRELFRKRYNLVGDSTPPPAMFYSPNITNSGLCMYGTTPDFLLPDYKFQAERYDRLQVANPYTPLPSQGYYPPSAGNRRVVDYFDNDIHANQVLNTIRHPQMRHINERKKPNGVFTKHGFRRFRVEKQTDPDLEEAYKLAMIAMY
jgi:hypothetical protein